MDLGIRGRVALVAASSRGLGRAVADELAAEGCSLIMCARGADALREAAESIRSASGAKVVAIPLDLSDRGAVEELVRAGTREIGPVDILVTNTGGPPTGPFEQHSPQVWADAVRQNLDSVVNLVRGVLPGMKDRRWGRIINVTSIAAKQPVDGLMLSNAVRAAVTGMARTLANEVAPFGVTVNNVLPGYTRTQRVDELAQRRAAQAGTSVEEALAVWEKEIPMGRLGEPREFAAMVAFLASERASYITGTSIPVDGGWVKGLL
jgi:3-oxoacyl-[acyl-carrier protein] reductase